MGNSQPEAPKAPPPTAKELKRKMNRSIDRMIREFNRDKFKLKSESKKMQRELEKMVKKGEPKASQRIIASNMLRNNKFLTKYEMMEAKMKGVKIQLAQVSTTTAMVDIMKGMGDLLGKATNNVDMNNINQVIQDFNYKMEQQEMMQEMMDDAMEDEDMDDEDEQVEDLLDGLEKKINGGKGGTKDTVEQTNTDDFSNMIDDLKK